MTTLQDQYTETLKQGQESLKQGQEVFAGAVESWTRTVQDAWGQFPVADPREAIDRFYETTGRLLDVQRDLVKGLVHSATAFGDTVRNETRKATEAVQPEV